MKNTKLLKVTFEAHGQTGGVNLRLVLDGTDLQISETPLNLLCDRSSQEWKHVTCLSARYSIAEHLSQLINNKFNEFEIAAKKHVERSKELDVTLDVLMRGEIMSGVTISARG